MNLAEDNLNNWMTSGTIPGVEGLYFVGTLDRRITFYSQQVRALELVRAMHESGKVDTSESIAVVGAGAAGVTCALALALLDCRVTLFDPADEVLQLQSDSPRLLHPHIYEWPSLGSLERDAALPFLNWELETGGAVAAKLVQEFHGHRARLQQKLFWKERHRLTSLAPEGSEWRLNFDNGSSYVVKQVILAMGFGEEKKAGAADIYDYWKQRGVGTAAVEPNAPASYLVSGNGDGALTDILNLMIKGFEHVQFTETFLNYFGQGVLRETVLAAHKDTDPEADLEPVYGGELHRVLLERGILDSLSPLLRRDRLLTINTSGPLLSLGRAAQLNQCMVFAVLAAAQRVGITVRRSTGKISDVIKHDDGLEAVGISIGGTPLSERFNHVILRHGPDKKARYLPAEKLFEAFEAASLERFNRHPDLLVTPTLNAETYTFFYERHLEKLADGAVKQQLAGQTAQEASTIIIGWDRATQSLVERGKVALRELVEQCETAPVSMTIQMDASTDRVKADDFVRLSKASGGKISLSVGAAVKLSWQEKLPFAPIVHSSSSRYPYCEVGNFCLGEYIDASLVRQLDVVLSKTKVAGKCFGLGHIAQDVLQATLATWDDWRATLDASTAIRRDFLAWLGSIGTIKAEPWDGDASTVERMASALVLILATHLGEPLKPAEVQRGNLTFDVHGLALGSAATEILGGNLLTDWSRPEQWDVDALILSGSAEVQVTGPDDTVLNAGDPGTSLSVARRIRPAIVRNDLNWRSALNTDLPTWRKAVGEEFGQWRKRQDDDRERVLA
ncbi:ABC-three component system protein [Pararhizobium sp.]|uniref:ABC-three component system protein n=1 Tax=Pararhizobium sp. TaxID=1977563 RepID=UPI003D0F15C3